MANLEFFSIQWDEWTSKQNLPYMALNVNGIANDFSKMVDFIAACSYFPFPHEMGDVRGKVITLTERILPEGVKFLDKVHSGAADGASVNKCFDPNSEASGISVAEKLDHQIIKARYSRLEEQTCILHRLVKLLEHVVDDDVSEASKSFKALILAIYAFFDLINSSQKNEQSLREI